MPHRDEGLRRIDEHVRWSLSTRNVFIAAWLTGATAFIHDARFDPLERLEIAEREGVSVICQAPTEYRMLAKRTELRPIPSLRRLVSAGEPLNPEVIRAFREQVGVPIHDGYGQTETGPVTGMRPGDDDPVRDGSMGRALPGIEARIDETPSSRATMGAKANTITRSLSATWVMVKLALPPPDGSHAIMALPPSGEPGITLGL